MAYHEPPADRMLRPDSGRLCCVECQAAGRRAVGDAIWAQIHTRETGHSHFAGAVEVKTRA